MAERRSGKDGEEVEDGEVTIREVAMIGEVAMPLANLRCGSISWCLLDFKAASTSSALLAFVISNVGMGLAWVSSLFSSASSSRLPHLPSY